MLGEDLGIPESLEVLEDGGPELGLVRAAQELPHIIHPDGGVLVLDELPDRPLDLGSPLLNQGLGLAALGGLLGLGGDHELPLLVQAQEPGRGEVVDLDAGETSGVLGGSGESGVDDVGHVC